MEHDAQGGVTDKAEMCANGGSQDGKLQYDYCSLCRFRQITTADPGEGGRVGLGETLMLGAALSMDAFAVTISDMFAYRGMSRRRAFLLPVAFGLFQGLMPLAGYLAGQLVAEFIQAYAGILTFAILGIIGGKMVIDAVREIQAARGTDENRSPAADRSGAGCCERTLEGDVQAACAPKKLTLGVIALQAIATSIDALAVGVSFAALEVEPLSTCALIGLTTFVLSCVALGVGKRFGTKLGEKATLLGGIVLIAIGVKALF